MMQLVIGNGSIPDAESLAEAITKDAHEGNLETWSFCRSLIGGMPAKCIYHDTEQTRQDHKVAYFHVHAESKFVYFDLHPAEGSDLSETEKLFLLARLSEILICNYKGRFFDIHIGWS